MGIKINKRGQVTIFIILAILIVVAVFLVFFLYEKTSEQKVVRKTDEPQGFVEQCVSEYVDEIADVLLERGGYVGGYLNMSFEYKEIPYLCYTPYDYSRCVIQEPVLIEHLEDEIYNYIEDKIDVCFEMMKKDFEKKSYEFKMSDSLVYSVELLPRKIKVKIKREIEAERADEVKTFKEFDSVTHSPLYDLANIVQRILEEEVDWANSELNNIRTANKWADIDLVKTGDDNKIYTITDTKTKLSWRFAVRGGVLTTP